VLRTLLTGKIHRAVVTEADLDYVGSITIDAALMERAGIREWEQVLVAVVDNGNRFETYAIPAPAGSGTICINGAAAHLTSPGDRVIVMAFAALDAEETEGHQPRIVLVDDDNVPLDGPVVAR
jgi:aspartate 1-decarboxylase